MSIQAPQGILNIPNATLRVGKLAVDEVVGADTILNTVARNTILLVDGEEYTANKNWALKLPNAWAGEFDIKSTGAGNYAEFNFYNEGASSNAQGYNLTFNDTAVELRYDGGSAIATGVLPSTIVNTYRKVRLMFERTILSVTVDGTLIFTHDDTSGPRPRVYSTTAGGFLNFFTDGGALKNLKIVNEKWISDGTSNIAYVGGGEVAVGKALAFNRVSNVSQIKVDANVVAEYTGPHDRPLRKYPEVAMTANDNSSTSGYVASRSSMTGSYDAWNAFSAYTSNANRWQSTANTYDSSGNWVSGVGATGVQFTDTASGQHSGEWIKIQLPKSIKLDYIRYLCNYTTFMTKDFVILGSNDDTSWTLLKSVTGGTSIDDVYHTLHINAGGYYKYYVWLTTAINGNGGEVLFNDISFYGHEEGSGSLDTTLKSVYNVPATTGTQLEVYYDAKDLELRMLILQEIVIR
jgi:hypothetical protein